MIPAHIGPVFSIEETNPSGNFPTANTKLIAAIVPQIDKPIRVFLISEFSNRVFGQKKSPRHFRTENAWTNPNTDRSKQMSSAATPAAYISFIRAM